jgi:hypothetical protein
MSLTCDCDYGEAEWFYDDTKEVAPLNTKRMRRCHSCKDRIAVGDECKPFPRWRVVSDYRDPEVIVRLYGEHGEMPLATWYLCDRCAGLYEALDSLGFCNLLEHNLIEMCREYGQMQRAAGVLRGEMIVKRDAARTAPPAEGSQ